MVIEGGTSNLKSPLEVSQKLHGHTGCALEILETLNANGNKELGNILLDIQTMSMLGKYYAYKIAGATHLAFYRKTKENKYRDQAIAELTKALSSCERYVDMALKQYHNPLWTNRVGSVDWKRTTNWVKQDIEIARRK